MSTHFSWITIATIPLFTIGTYICFRNQGYNFVELFVLNTFKASQKLFAHLLSFPLLVYYNGSPQIQKITSLIYAIYIVLMFWTNIQFFNKMSKTKAFFLSVLSHIIFWFCFLIVIFIVLKLAGKLA